MEFFVTWALILGLLLVPASINYYVNRYFTPAGSSSLASTLELVGASLILTFAILALGILVVLLISLGWDDLKERIADFVQLGMVRFAQDRPVGLTGVLTAVSVASMALMALLGVLRIPSRFVR